MKRVIQFIVGAVVGFGVAYGVLYFRDMNQSEYLFIYFACAVTVGLLAWSAKLYNNVKALHHTPLSGDAEDEADEKKYKKASDFSMVTHIAMVLSLITVAISVIQKTSIILIVVAFALLIVSCIAGSFVNRISKYLYPTRELPKAETVTSSDDFVDQMIVAADDGEKFIILQGMYKSNYLMSLLLVMGIIIAIAYSALQESSQLFSIIVMGVILAAGNIKYQRAIRNK